MRRDKRTCREYDGCHWYVYYTKGKCIYEYIYSPSTICAASKYSFSTLGYIVANNKRFIPFKCTTSTCTSYVRRQRYSFESKVT